MPAPPQPRIPGLTHSMGVLDLPDRKPGIFGALTPKIKSHEVVEWFKGQVEWADKVRVQMREAHRAEKKYRQRKGKSHKNKKSKKHSSSSS